MIRIDQREGWTDFDVSGSVVPMSTPPSPLGPNLQRHRLKAGHTQREVADKLDVTIRTLQRWEGGETNPGYGDLSQLARLYDTTVPDFYAPLNAKKGRAA
jgi:transcriptional regulator with XRE-family HTH domain